MYKEQINSSPFADANLVPIFSTRISATRIYQVHKDKQQWIVDGKAVDLHVSRHFLVLHIA